MPARADREGAVVVTGATGLLGRAVTSQLVEQGRPVVAVVRPGTPPANLVAGVRHVPIDLGSSSWDSRDLEARGPLAAVIHLAQSRRYRDFPEGADEVFAVSALGAVRLAQLALAAGARFVLASSGGVYAPQPRPLQESDPLGPAGDLGYYLTVKQVAEQLLACFHPEVRATVLRYFFIYGPGQAPTMLVARLIESVRSRTAIELSGSDGPRLNPVYVTDAAAATIACLESDAPPVLNVAGPDVLSLREICEHVGDVLGIEPRFRSGAQPAHDLVADIGSLSTLRGPRVSLADGLKRVIAADEE